MDKREVLVGAIDEGTSSTRFLVFSARTLRVVASHQIPITSVYPQEGWVEQDPVKILDAVNECIAKATESLTKQNISPADIVAIGITNQRETTIAWDKLTGEPLHNAIVWLDMRTSSTVEHLLESVPNRNKHHLQRLCGLPLSPYFSALKIKWLLENVARVRQAVQEDRCCFGTMDTWLIWNLTGGVNGGLYLTDVSNASRTMLMSLDTLSWDPTLCAFFDISTNVLPEIRSSSEIYGPLSDGPLKGVPISGCLGDQQAALVGQMCLKQGQAKSTYGTGCFLLYNTGNKAVLSSHGLLTTVAYQMGKTAAPVYALEGSVSGCGAAFGWLKQCGLLSDISETESLAEQVSSSGDVYFVPAFSGLYAPYWQRDARGVICGISEETTRTQIIRAALEAVCFQTRDILEAMHKDCGIPLDKLKVDGGMTSNSLLMQLQADLTGVAVQRPLMTEATALGAAMAAGRADGVQAWDLDDMRQDACTTFKPAVTDDERDIRYSKWKMAIERSFGWDTPTKCD